MRDVSLGSVRLPESTVVWCRSVQRQYGKSYALATRFFPVHLQQATVILYAFFRLPDEIVDAATDERSAVERLDAWEGEWKRVVDGGDTAQPVLSAMRTLCVAYRIPWVYTEHFLEAMRRDTAQHRYQTYVDLESYMYGSAAVVGLMMSEVIGYSDPVALAYAKQLGEAMQLTNFLRDIPEDYGQRQRVYVPQEDLERFGVTEQDIARGVVTEPFRALMRFEIARADALYASAEQGIALSYPEGRRAVRLASRLYQAILRQIERQGYDVFRRRAVVPWWRKVGIILCYW